MFSLFGAIGSILGSDKVISKGMELIDDAFESDEERRESKTTAKIDLMKAYAPFKIAQRYMALMFSVNFISCFWFAVYLWGTGKDIEGFKEIFTTFQMGWIMLTIVGFYFSGGLTESIGRTLRKKKELDK